METNNQIQLLKSQIMNIKSGLDNISLQNNNMLIMNNIQVGELLLNLSIQILNTGIQAFNIGKNISMNYNKYFDQLKLISQQINSLINENNLIQQKQMRQLQQMMIPPIMIQQNQNEQFQNSSQDVTNKEFVEKINVLFEESRGIKILIPADPNMTLENLFNIYESKIKDKISMNEMENIIFYVAMGIQGQ